MIGVFSIVILLFIILFSAGFAVLNQLVRVMDRADDEYMREMWDEARSCDKVELPPNERVRAPGHEGITDGSL